MAVIRQDNTLLSYEDWQHKRYETIGASIFGILIYGSKYSSSVEQFYKYIGAPTSVVENIRMFLGKETEDISAHCWKHYAGTEQSVVDNIRKGTPVKDCEDVKVTLFNDQYKHLSCTPDREILPFGKYAGRGRGSLEIKNTQSWVLAQYEPRLPPDNAVQLCGQIMIGEYDYGELFYFVDNMRFKCYPVERRDTKGFEATILHYTEDFWNRVEKARPLYNQMYEANRNMNQRMVAKLTLEIAQLEPPVQNTDGWRNFINDHYKDRLGGAGVIPGTADQLLIARKHKELTQQIDKISEEKLAVEIQIKKFLKEYNTLDFGKDGKVSWAANKSGTRVFLNKVK